MAELLLAYASIRTIRHGRQYAARAYGAHWWDGTKRWHAWLEFRPIAGGRALSTAVETVQPNRTCLVYWATGLTATYLDGALARAAARGAGQLGPPAVSDAPPRTAADPWALSVEGRMLLKSLGIAPS